MIKIGINRLTSIKNLSFFVIKALSLSKNNRQLILKLFSSRLNIKPYNKLNKEAVDFKKCKKELTMPYNTKCFYLKTRTLEE